MTALDPLRPRRRICFVSPNNDDFAADGGPPRHIGGVEIQIRIVARELSRRGHHVSLVTWDSGQLDGDIVNGITMHKMCSPSDGIPGLRFVYPRWTSLRKAMARADAHVYIQAGAGSLTGQVAHWCRQQRRRFVFATASDVDCTRSLVHLRTRRERILYRYGLRRADAVIAQTLFQQRLLAGQFGRETQVIAYCCLEATYASRSSPLPNDGARPRILWVGRFSPEKRLELFLDLAATAPTLRFDVVGGANSDTRYSRDLLARARQIPNIVLHGRVPHAHVERFYCETAALVCTSAFEGFPNVFLEAWSCGVPVVSTVDPDGIIATHGLGGVADTVEGLHKCLQGLLREPESWRASSQRARQYFIGHHTVGAAAGAYHDLLARIESE
jgi:glycosyltransferase involved in cell wall biosynthesis